MGWQVEWRGVRFLESELTLNQARTIEDALDATWVEIAPLRSARHAYVILGHVIAWKTGRPLAEVEAELGDATVNEVAAAVTPEQDDRPTEYDDGVPQPADDTETT